MLRADFDALPVEEQTGLPYASIATAVPAATTTTTTAITTAATADGQAQPVMHACGHDMHTACLVGAATILAQTADTWTGTVLAVFQPAEETGQGARAMVSDGLLDRFPKPDIILAQHVSPLPAGWIGHASGPVMAASDTARVVLYGKGGHGARPEAAVDPVLMAANVVTRLQGIVAREVPPSKTAVVTVGRMAAGTKANIIPDTAELGISVRAYDPAIRQLVKDAVERVIRAEASASNAGREPAVTWVESVPLLVSDPEATAATVAAFAARFGQGRLLPLPRLTTSEDAGVFGEAGDIPTVYWFWGGLDENTVVTAFAEGRFDELPQNHSPLFAPVIEPTLTTGVDALVVAARTWLGPATDDQ